MVARAPEPTSTGLNFGRRATAGTNRNPQWAGSGDFAMGVRVRKALPAAGSAVRQELRSPTALRVRSGEMIRSFQ